MKPRAGEHTKGPWRTHDALVFLPGSAGGFSLQNCPAPEANARRIVACVNACEGIDTNYLERVSPDKDWWQKQLTALAKTEAERDQLRAREKELVAVIEEALDYCSSEAIGTAQQELAENDRMRKTLIAALSKVRGGLANKQ